MGDMGDVWKDINERDKENRLNKQNWSKELMQMLCLDHGIEMREIAEYQFRLTKGLVKIDIYPQRQKFHNLKDNSRGKYKDLEAFVIHHFKNDNR